MRKNKRRKDRIPLNLPLSKGRGSGHGYIIIIKDEIATPPAMDVFSRGIFQYSSFLSYAGGCWWLAMTTL